MTSLLKIMVIVIGIILMAIGALNIWDDARVFTYDLTSLFAGLGFILLGAFYKNHK
jgi:hypothetical protein